ncbi:hypothetical protein P153DRAFT_146953 [Dothidotthia symphoricarpi CBS 119687]|uniref:Uncharacterized protein n=1 Tax=Dothidotthia symphoricarpi CBS 119687 TaxID=1392245 RepID=A0A6A5ZZF5_9PLEO|nr:uncharacterized protein P153DRAFT_146953 [Dothidotthia symphoricarpi CBS 119687]KAF2123808.1 hypothetical protein P153DRAFT_146953 [Dothidotthia symphoricarpi CBS 119687]
MAPPLPAPRCRGITQRNLQCRNPAKYPAADGDAALLNRCQLHIHQTIDFNSLVAADLDEVLSTLANVALGNADDIEALAQQANLTNTEVGKARREHHVMEKKLLSMDGDTHKDKAVVPDDAPPASSDTEHVQPKKDGKGRNLAAAFGMQGMVRNGPPAPTGPTLISGVPPSAAPDTTKHAPTKSTTIKSAPRRVLPARGTKMKAPLEQTSDMD